MDSCEPGSGENDSGGEAKQMLVFRIAYSALQPGSFGGLTELGSGKRKTLQGLFQTTSCKGEKMEIKCSLGLNQFLVSKRTLITTARLALWRIYHSSFIFASYSRGHAGYS